MSLELDEHRLYLSDRNRLRAFTDALREVVRPSDVVLDLGSGTGILGMLACQAGAARVYGVDNGPMAGVARSIVRANGFQDRMTIVRGHSTQVALPEPVSLVVTDQIGNFAFNAGLFEFMADARTRLLAPGGRCIPAWVELWTAPAEHPAIREHVHFWSERPAGLDYSPARQVAQSSGHPCEIEPTALLADAAATIRVEPPSATDTLSGTITGTVTRDGILDGVAGWFVAGLSPSVTMTNAPGDPNRINRRPVLLPLAAPRPVTRGDAIEIRLRVIAPLSVVEWRVLVTPGDGQRWVERGSTFPGLLMSREDLDHSRPDWKPALTNLGEARRTVLELCDGGRALREIEREILQRHGDVVATPEAAAVFVAEVVTRYAR